MHTRTPQHEPTITIRAAAPRDTATLERLAALDETARIFLPALIAEQDGRPVAALSLADGLVAADPFVRTAPAVELLELRAGRLAAPAGSRRRISLGRRARRTVPARV